MKYCFFFLLTVLFMPLNSFSQSYDSALETGIHDFYSGNWNMAETQFDSLILEKPTQPEAYFFRSMIPFWKYFFGGESKNDASDFLDWSEKAIKVTEKHLRNNSTDTSSVLFLSGLHGYRALVAADQEEYSIAIKSGMTGFNYTRKILALNDDNPDAKIGRGIYYYMTGSIPSQIKWMAGALGFDGDKQWGFNELESAAQSSSRVKVDANMILTYLYLQDKLPENASVTINRLLELYPQNSIFNYYRAKISQELNDTETALQYYKRVIQLNDSQLNNLLQTAERSIIELNSALHLNQSSK